MVKGLRISNQILVGLLGGSGAEDCGGSTWWAVGCGLWVLDLDLGVIGFGLIWVLDFGFGIGRDQRSWWRGFGLAEIKDHAVMCVVCVASSVDPMVIFLKWVCWDMWGFGLV